MEWSSPSSGALSPDSHGYQVYRHAMVAPIALSFAAIHTRNRHMELGQIALKIDDLKGRCGALRGYL